MRWMWMLSMVWVCAGCGGMAYEREISGAREEVEEQNWGAALVEVDRALAESDPWLRGDVSPLLLLERATVLQAMGRYAESSRDFRRADGALEVLELSATPSAVVAEHVFSGAQGRYQSAPYEKLLVNSMNMLNYLALGDEEGARVEARRLEVMATWLEAEGLAVYPALGAYLAGFVYEQRGESMAALRWYGRALGQLGLELVSRPVRCLMEAGARGLPGQPLLEVATWVGRAERCRAREDEGEVLVVVLTGYGPERVTEEMTVGEAVDVASTVMDEQELAATRRELSRHWGRTVRYPWLKAGQISYVEMEVWASEMRWRAQRVSSTGVAAREHGWASLPEVLRGVLHRARARARVDAGMEGLRLPMGIGFVDVGDAVTMQMEEGDVPDTRGWTSLPGAFWVARGRAPAGEMALRVVGSGVHLRERVVSVEVPAGGWTVVVVRMP